MNSLITRVNEHSDRVRIEKERQERINARKKEELETTQAGLFCIACFVGVCIIACVTMAIIGHYTGIIFD